MKWYQPIECDNTVKNPLICDFDNLEQWIIIILPKKTGLMWDHVFLFVARTGKNCYSVLERMILCKYLFVLKP